MVILPMEARGVRVVRQGRSILGPLDLDVAGEGVTVVIGPNGSGKTTLLRALHGLDRLRQGEVRFAVPNGEAQPRQAFVFQSPVLLRRTARENIAYPLRLRGAADLPARVEAVAARLGLTSLLDQRAVSLSAGEQQKLALARALVTEPELLFLDEPCASLDGAATRDIEEALRQARDAGTRIVMSTHDMGQARRLASDVLFLNKGRIAATGATPVFFDTPPTDEAAVFLRGDLLP